MIARRHFRKVLRAEKLEARIVLNGSMPGDLDSILPLADGAVGPALSDSAVVVTTDQVFPTSKAGLAAKLGPVLAAVRSEFRSHQIEAPQLPFQSRQSHLQISDDLILVQAVASGDPGVLLVDLDDLGMQGSAQFGAIVSGRIPLDMLDDMAALESLQFASPTANPRTNVGLVTSQGDVAMNADAARATFGVDGSGVKIGVLSDSFDTGAVGSYATDVASGDLPAGIQVLDDLPGGTDEGRGMLQLIHDVAPGADLAFHTAFNGIADFAQGIIDLAAAGADVIIDDVIYFEEPMFQDGAIAQAVDTVVAGGVSYFSSAGNGDRQSYESAFVDSGEDLFVDDGSGPAFAGNLHDFDPTAGVDYMQSITVPFFSGFVMSFQWDDPFFSVSGGAGADSDLDIYVVDAAGTTVYASSTTRNIGGDAVEVLQFTNTFNLIAPQFNIMIANFDGPAPGLMKYLWYGPVTVNEYGTSSSTIFGHANAAGAQAVGAAAYSDTPAFGQDPALLEPFSSAGGTPIIFDTAGNLLPTPEIRLKPEIVAPDGGNTTFFPQGNDTDGDGFPNFFGTSAAAPHAGAVAALMLEANPALTPAEIYTALQSTALDMGAPGFDHDTGYGLIQADQALGEINLVPRLAVSIDAAAIDENGGSTTATVTRWGVDIDSPLIVTLGSDDESEATVPVEVTIAADDQSVSFPIDAVDDLLSDGTQTVTITATAGGLLDGSDTLQVTDDEPQIISQWASTIIDFSSEWILGFPGQWNASQALGPPDTFTYGDFPTAWAASSADGSGVEYLTLGYATPVFATGLIVRETFNPGFVAQVDVREAGTSTLHTVWTGSDPSLPGTVADFEITWPATAFQVDAVKVTINSNNTIGDFEEIDAVRLDGWDQQPPTTVSIVALDPAAAENPVDTGTFIVTRTDTDGDLIVSYSIDPSSTAAASDYIALSGSVQIDDGQSSATITLTPVDDVEEEGDEMLTLTLDVGAGYQVGSPASATVTIADDDLSTTDVYAATENTISGTVTAGALADTYASDDVYEEITERHSGGKPSNRISFLEHIWTFNVGGGDPATFYVEAVRIDSGEGDEFVFAYSTDGSSYTDMLSVTKTADDDAYQTFLLPPGISGTLFVRVTDLDRTVGNNILDTILIDEMFIRSAGGGLSLPLVTISATDASAAEEGSDPGEFTITRSGDTSGSLTVFYTVGGTATAGPAADQDYNTLSGSVTISDGSPSATITVTPVDDVLEEGNETVTLTLAVDTAYIVGPSDADTVTIADNDLTATNALAESETTVSGTVTAGDYTDTFFNDGVFEVIQERESNGNPKKRYSFLEHKWTFNITAGDTFMFFVEAFRSVNFEGDDFKFAYSTDDVTYTNMLTVSKTSDDNSTQSYAFLETLSGTVYVRVTDTDQTPGNKTLDTVFIDQMYIETFQALHAADVTTGAIEGAAALTPAQLAPAVEQAVAYWAAWGIDSSRLDALSRTQIQIADLGGSLLGMASSSGRVWIDRDAAIGYDLGTVVAHEFGHVLGFDHNDRRDVMAARLLPSIPKASDRIAERRSGELAIDSFWSDALPSPADARYTVLQTRRADDLKPASVTRLDRRRDAVDSIFANFTGPRRPEDLPARQDSRRRARSEHEFEQSHVEELKLLADTK
ncbi:MAG: S8 family serine peptidase [Planctomycetes bacterium]|nr:S8 family serine peptidase [Planctomycetota bacterium]